MTDDQVIVVAALLSKVLLSIMLVGAGVFTLSLTVLWLAVRVGKMTQVIDKLSAKTELLGTLVEASESALEEQLSNIRFFAPVRIEISLGGGSVHTYVFNAAGLSREDMLALQDALKKKLEEFPPGSNAVAYKDLS
jgi:hypothetical protein